MIKKTLLFIAALSALTIRAQDSTVFKPANKVVAFLPQYFISNGIRADFDFKIGQKHWIQLCPQVYVAERASSVFDRFTSLTGAGLMVYDRIYLQDNKSHHGLYINYGVSYNYFYLEYLNHTAGDINSNTVIQKVGGDVNIGYQHIFFDKLIIDFFTGMGIRYSTYDMSVGGNERFNS